MRGLVIGCVVTAISGNAMKPLGMKPVKAVWQLRAEPS